MKAKSSSILLVILFVLVIPVISHQEAGWKGKIEYENGIQVIKNPNEPQYGEISLELEEDLVIEDRDGKDYYFQWLCDVNVDSKGTIYILDRQQHKGYIFDKLGNYMKAIGGKGQGPGEFNTPSRIFTDSEDRINVLDRSKLHLFNNKADFIKSINFNFFVFSCSLKENGNILAHANETGPKGLSQRIYALNPEGKRIKTIDEQNISIENIKNPSPNSGFGPTLHLTSLDNNSSIYGNSKEYRLYVIDSSGNRVRIIERDETKKRELYFNRLLSNEEGIIFVDRWGLESEKGKPSFFDIFSTEGRYIYRAYINVTYIKAIKSENIYTLESNSDTGAQYVKRYKIKNWDRIKEDLD